MLVWSFVGLETGRAKRQCGQDHTGILVVVCTATFVLRVLTQISKVLTHLRATCSHVHEENFASVSIEHSNLDVWYSSGEGVSPGKKFSSRRRGSSQSRLAASRDIVLLDVFMVLLLRRTF